MQLLKNYVLINSLENHMKSINNYVLEEDVKSVYEYYWQTHDFNDWLYGVYDNLDINESDYYNDKYEYIHSGWDKPDYKIWQSLIYERLADSFKLTDKNIDTIKNIKGIESIKIVNKKNYKFLIKVNDDFEKESFDTLMNFYGYAMDYEDSSDNTYMYEAVKSEKVDERFDYVYHVTHQSAWEKIQKYGLIPKQKYNHHSDFINNNKRNIEYPSRIYCFKPDTDIDFIKKFAKLNNYIHHRKINDIIILKIEVNNNMIFYTDGAFDNTKAMFTMEPIRTKYISKICGH